MELADYDYEDIEVGKVFQFARKITLKDIDDYAKITGDHNPLHCDEKYAQATKFEGRVVHGMLAGSLFSTLVGMVCPGRKNVYVSQTLNFKKPIYPDSELIIRGTVQNKVDSIQLIVIITEIIVNNSVAIQGEAKVTMLSKK